MGRTTVCLLLLALIAGCNGRSVKKPKDLPHSLQLVVAYCPSAFKGKGAVVNVDSYTGAFTVDRRFEWPGGTTLGCPANVSPNDLVSGDLSFLDFTDDWGEVVEINVRSGNITKVDSAKSPVLFDGFTSFELGGKGTFLQGPTPHVTQKGWCSDGCFQYGQMALASGDYKPLQDIPFKAVMTDVHFLNKTSQTYYIQASYPLEAQYACSADQTKDCLVGIDTQTGAIRSSVLANNFTVYKYSTATSDDGTEVLAWVYGFEAKCDHAYSDFAFAWVNLKDASARLIACIPRSVTVDTNPMIAEFAPGGELFAQASGDPETGRIQLLVFEAKTGKVRLNTQLKNLPKVLGVGSEAPFVMIWSVAFLDL